MLHIMSPKSREEFQYIKHTLAEIKWRQKQKYQRGDAESTMNDWMFISIMRQGILKREKLGRDLTKEEGHGILRDHGWTVNGK